MSTYTLKLFFALMLTASASTVYAGESNIENSFEFNVNTGGNSAETVSEGTQSVTVDMTTVIDGEVVEDVHETYTGTSVSKRYESHSETKTGESISRYEVEIGTDVSTDTQEPAESPESTDGAEEPTITNIISDDTHTASSGLDVEASVWLASVHTLHEALSIVLAYVYSFF